MLASDIISICATIIALAASAGVLWQGGLTRRHNMLSVKPHFSFNMKKHPSFPVSYTLKNTGLGPAFIKDFVLVVDNCEYRVKSTKDVIDVLSLIDIKTSGKWMFTLPDIDSSISNNDSLVLLEFQHFDKDLKLFEALEKNLHRLSFKIEYECMYGNRFSSLFSG